MSEHKFRVGQLVQYLPKRPAVGLPGAYEITSQMPASEGELRYRIKHVGEAHERMAKEGDLKEFEDAP